MPAKGTKRVTERQRKKIAAAIAAGRTQREIARETGLSRRSVERHAVDPRTRTLIQEIRSDPEDQEEFRAMWRTFRRRLARDLMDSDADVRHKAGLRLLRAIVLGDEPERIGQQGTEGGLQLMEALEIYRRVEIIRQPSEGHT